MTKVTVAPITTSVRGLSGEAGLGRENGLDKSCVVSIDNTLTIRRELLGRSLGILLPDQERALAGAIILAFDLDVPLSFLNDYVRAAPPRRETPSTHTMPTSNAAIHPAAMNPTSPETSMIDEAATGARPAPRVLAVW